MHTNYLREVSKYLIYWWGYGLKKYKYKLNMLEPGTMMIKAMGISVVLGIVFDITNIILFSYIFYGFAALLGIVLWILLLIESHQDKV